MTKLQSLMIERRNAPRHQFCVPVTISIPPGKNPSANLLQQKTLQTSGFTKDLSDVGIGFYVSSIRLHEFYLVGDNRQLIAKVELPEGDVTMKIIGMRYERESGNSTELKYLIGARIAEMDSADREIYRRFLRQKNKHGKFPIQDFLSETPEG